MKRMLSWFGMACIAMGSNAQSINVPMLNTPKYLDIDSAITTTTVMNTALIANTTGYTFKSGDSSTVSEKIYTYSTVSGQSLKITYTIKTGRTGTVVNRITLRGSVEELKKIHKAFFNSDRTIDVKNNTYQLDYFLYGGKKFYVRFDPDSENNAGTSDWSLIIGKY